MTYVYQIPYRGATAYCVEWTDLGKRKRKVFQTRSAADTFADNLRSDSNQANGEWSRRSEAERQRIILAVSDAERRGLSVDDLIARASQMPATKSRKLSEMIADLLEAKRKAGRHADYVYSLGLVLRQFARGRESVRVDLLTIGDVESFLDAHRLAYRATLRAKLSTLFNFAVRRGFLTANPCAKLEPGTHHAPPPQVFTPSELRTCLEWFVLNPRGFAFFLLTTLAGLRPDEARKTTWRCINFKSGEIEVKAQTSKVRQRRIVQPMAEAISWLRIAKNLKAELPLSNQVKRELIRTLRGVVGFKVWPKDITRHTALSIWLCRTKSADFVAEMAGNSASVLKRHYAALVSARQLEAYVAVLQTVRIPVVKESFTTETEIKVAEL